MTDRITDPQVQEFFVQIDQSNRFYQEAIVLIAARSIRGRQDGQDTLLVTVTPPKQRIRHWLGNLLRKLIHRFDISYPGKREEGKSVETNDPDTQRHIVLDMTPLPWPPDQSLLAKEVIKIFPQHTQPIDEQKGDQHHE